MNKELITLRPLVFEDLSLLSKWNFDPEISLYFPARPEYSEHEQIRWIERNLQASDKRKFMILHGENEAPIGSVGFMKIDSKNKHAELGITIGEKELWGTGVALLALHEALKIGFDELDLHLIYAHVFEHNRKANRFFSKAGFTTDGILRDHILVNDEFISIVVHSITADEFTRILQ